MYIDTAAADVRKLAIVGIEGAQEANHGGFTGAQVYLSVEDDGFSFGDETGILEDGNRVE